jgi:ribonuclease HI
VKDKINEVETDNKNMNIRGCIEALMILRWITSPKITL